ncbi:hypothetical protein AB0E63_44415, partial [Kribbella sp. NPDC026596]|uniref:hypothetical protein n=1 Tax=Kribbella sp. NPDC026596 TaxID=3155122 RepID=UPI0033F96765
MAGVVTTLLLRTPALTLSGLSTPPLGLIRVDGSLLNAPTLSLVGLPVRLLRRRLLSRLHAPPIRLVRLLDTPSRLALSLLGLTPRRLSLCLVLRGLC